MVPECLALRRRAVVPDRAAAGGGVSRPQLVAPVSGFSAWWLAFIAERALPGALESLARRGADVGLMSELRLAVAGVRLAADEWAARRAASVGGSTEAEVTQATPRWPHECTTATAAALLGVSPRRVLQLVADGRLDARRAGRVWLVDAGSVELHGILRRSA